MRTKKQKKWACVWSVVAVVAVAAIGGVFVALGKKWFSGLERPDQFPPDYVIPIMWTIIYVVFAIDMCLFVVKTGFPKKVLALLIVNGIQNVLWCLLFFALGQTFLGLVVVVLVTISAFCLIFEMAKHSMVSFYLTAIYPIWTCIATCLNLAMWILN